MKRISLMLLVFTLVALLVSCATTGRYPYTSADLSRENWRTQMLIDPARWTAKADSWFKVGSTTLGEYRNETAPYGEAISREAVRVPNFHHLKVYGDFQIQVSGDPNVASVWIEGPNDAVRSIAVVVRDNTLSLVQAQNAPLNMNRVIVHVTMRSISSLTSYGNGRIEGIRLFSSSLIVDSNGTGNIFLAGHLNVRRVISRNCGSVNIYTIKSMQTEIEACGCGDVNIKAESYIDLKSIRHTGNADVNVVGAVGNNVYVDAKGKGRVNIFGRVGIKEIRASEQVCVFVYDSASARPCIYVYDDAHVGIAGSAGTFYAYTTRNAKLMASSLTAETIYAESSGYSHMNITGTNRVFATARDYSTVYFWGNPDVIDPFEKNEGAIILMNDEMAGVPIKFVKYRRQRDTLDPAIRMGTYEQNPTRAELRANYYRG